MKILRKLAPALIFVWLLSEAWLAGAGPNYPLKRSANGRYLVDQTNAPVLLMGDSPQALMVNLSEEEAEAFFADRSAHGFNTLWINLLCATYTGGRSDASTFDGILPFTATIPSTSSYDLSRTNEAYFAHVDRVINLAAQYGSAADGRTRLEIRLSHTDLGRFVGCSRETVNKQMRAWEEAGIVAREGGRITVCKPLVLRRIAGQE